MPGRWKMRLVSLAFTGWVLGHTAPSGATQAVPAPRASVALVSVPRAAFLAPDPLDGAALAGVRFAFFVALVAFFVAFFVALAEALAAALGADGWALAA